jgi:hypothetical protein
LAQFETLVLDIEKLFDGKDLSERINHLTDRLNSTFIARFLEYSEERKPALRLSNVGRPFRQLYYELNGYKGEPLSPQVKFKFLYGSLLEELVLFLAKEAGHSVTREQEECEVDGVKGHIDGFVDGVLVDVKSCSTRSFEKFSKGTLYTDDPFGYIGQLSGYSQALKTERAAFIPIDKVLGKIITFELSQDTINKYDVYKRIEEQKKYSTGKVLPPRCYEPKPISKTDKSGNLVLATGCSYCAYKIECWKDSNDGQGLQLRHYASAPKWFTKIVKEPRLKPKEEGFETFPTKEE